jgi:uncharacterized RDD family membrane protein YckC
MVGKHNRGGAMTDPQDPFAAPGDQPTPPPAYGTPAYGTPAPGTPIYGMPSGTPEYATWGLRVVASLIDFAIIIAAQLVFSAVSSQLAQLVAIGVEIYFAYLVGTKGQSPGKQVMKIKIVRDADGQLLGFGTAVLRWLAHIIDAIPLLLGFLWPLWDKKRQTFADKIVGSVAVKA